MSTLKTLSYQPLEDVQATLDVSQMRGWSIVIDDAAIPSDLYGWQDDLTQKYAAEEFQRWFEGATRIQLPLHTTIEGRGPHHIYIGSDAAGVDPTGLGDEEIRIVVENDRIIIVGGRPRGTLYAVYQFLEELLGLRFLTHDHTHVPDASRLKIPCGTYTYNPPFSYRGSYYRENSQHPDFAARLKVNTVTTEERLGGKTRQTLISHSFHLLVPFTQYGDDHPEYYALVDGERHTDTHGAGPQLCVTNPEVIEIAATAAIKYLDEHTDVDNVSVSQADTAAYCRCDVCEAVNQREGTPMGAQLAFVNAVAERVEKVHPNAKVGTLAYWYTRQVPKTIRPRDNIQIQLCSIECCTLHAIDDPNCERNRAFCKDTYDWGKISTDIWVWNYNTNFRSYDLPFPNLRVIGPNVRYFLRNNTKGLFMQANGTGTTGELCDLRNYLIANLIWNPNLDDQAVLEEFVRLHYQSAAQPILDYINMLHDNAEAKGLHPNCFPSAEDVGLDAEIARQALNYFAEAHALATDDDIKARVEKASISAHKAMIVAGGELDAAERNALINRYIALCKRYQMTHAAETQLVEEYFKEVSASL
jgi:hypothetical protein